MTGLHLVADPVQFDRCPPLMAGACMVEAGHSCALSTTCCVNAPVPQVALLAKGSGNTSEKGALAAAARWRMERQAA